MTDYVKQALGRAASDALREAKNPPFWRHSNRVAIVWEWHDSESSCYVEAPTPEQAHTLFRAAKAVRLRERIEAVCPAPPSKKVGS